MEYTRRTWKKALRNPDNCPSCYMRTNGAGKVSLDNTEGSPPPIVSLEGPGCEQELRKAVGRGRFMVREMIGVIQLKKYRTLKRRYDNPEKDPSLSREYVNLLIRNLDDKSKGT